MVHVALGLQVGQARLPAKQFKLSDIEAVRREIAAIGYEAITI